MGWLRGLMIWTGDRGQTSPIDFYDRLLRILEQHGFSREQHQTPLEFASQIGINEAAIVTSAYNRVRFGGQQLSSQDWHALKEALARLEKGTG